MCLLLLLSTEVLVHQANDMETVSDDPGSGEVLPGDFALSFGQAHNDKPDIGFAAQTPQIAFQASL